MEDEYKIRYVNKAEAMEKRLQIGIDWTLDVVFVVHDSLASVLREKERKKHVLTLKLYDKNKWNLSYPDKSQPHSSRLFAKATIITLIE